MPDTAFAIAVSCSTDVSVPQDLQSRLCDRAKDTLAQRLSGHAVAAWDGTGAPPRFIDISVQNWGVTGLDLHLRWKTAAGVAAQQSLRSFSISDKPLSEKRATDFMQRVLTQTDFAF